MSTIGQRLARVSDAELYSALNAVCSAAGIDGTRREALTSDIPRLRRMLSSLSDAQLAALFGSLGESEKQAIMKRLGGV